MNDSKESAVTQKAPRVPTIDQLNELMEMEEGRRAHLKFAAGWGAIGFFGLVDFAAAFLRGTVGFERLFSLVIALWFSGVAIAVWREARHPRIPEEDDSANPKAE
jgi:hypothetical protein